MFVPEETRLSWHCASTPIKGASHIRQIKYKLPVPHCSIPAELWRQHNPVELTKSICLFGPPKKAATNLSQAHMWSCSPAYGVLGFLPCKQSYSLMCARTRADPSLLLTSTDAHQAGFLRHVLPWQHVKRLLKLQNRQTTGIIFITFYL